VPALSPESVLEWVVFGVGSTGVAASPGVASPYSVSESAASFVDQVMTADVSVIEDAETEDRTGGVVSGAAEVVKE